MNQKAITYILATVFLFIVCVLALLFYFSFKQGFLLTDTNTLIESVTIERVDGSLEPVHSSSSVVGADIVVGDTAIRIGDSGRFIFTEVSSTEGLVLTHPKLLRRIRFVGEPLLNTAGLLSIPFDVQLYNQLITILDLEARGKLSEIKPWYDPRLVEADEVFAHTPFYDRDDVMKQELVLSSVTKESFQSDVLGPLHVVSFTVMKDTESAIYHFVQQVDENAGQRFYLVK